MLSVTASVPSAPSYGGTTYYQYDARNELTQEQGPATGGSRSGDAYDAAGNPTTLRGQALNAANTANQLPGSAYDKAGNPTTYNGTAASFDAEDRMTSFGSALTAGYRGDGLRAWKRNAGGTTYFLYSGTLLVCEMNTSGAATAVNTSGAAGLLSRHTSSGSVFYTFDAHGSVCQRLSGGGAVLSTQTFDAYGDRQSTDGNADPYCGFGGQSGYYTDWETGTAASALELLTFRYYDPTTGRFLTRDPIGFMGGANPYEYCNDQPVNGQDPTGTAPIGGPIGGCIGAALGAFAGSGGGGLPNDCNQDYDLCLEGGDCLVDAASALLGGFIIAICPECLPIDLAVFGCLEGLLSAMGHTEVENICRNKYKPCDPPDSDMCKTIANLVDISPCSK